MRNICSSFTAIGVIVALSLSVGCASKPETKRTDFEQWKQLAKKSRGFSPASRQRTIELSPKKIETIAPGQVRRTLSRPLPDRKITMKMHEIDVAVLLRALARAVDLNIMINDSVKGRISINVQNAKWKQVFLGLLNSQSLTYEWEGDIIRIVTFEDLSRRLKNLEAEEKILTKKRELEMQAPLVTKIIPIDFSKADQLKESVEKVLSAKKPGEPIGSVMVDKHTNALIVQATPVDIARIVPLITELDRPTPQILIEAHIIETTNQTARELGIQWGGLYHNANAWITPDAATDITGITPGTGGTVNPAAGIAANFPGNLANAAQSGTGLSLGVIGEFGDDILALQLSALEEEGKLNILSSPSITTLDNRKATIESGNEIPIQIVEDDDVEVVYKSAVLSLEVTPHVIQDNALKLEIATTKDEVGTVSTVNQYPTIITKKANTNVILFDGQTTVIGGLKKNTSQNSEAGIPLLWKIPVLGHLFKNQSRLEQMEEILIFITPHILKTRPSPAPAERGGDSPAQGN
ncbi:MAG: type IV pilus secretin PilQ [Desulfobacteraceae bacterium]